MALGASLGDGWLMMPSEVRAITPEVGPQSARPISWPPALYGDGPHWVMWSFFASSMVLAGPSAPLGGKSTGPWNASRPRAAAGPKPLPLARAGRFAGPGTGRVGRGWTGRETGSAEVAGMAFSRMW